MVPPAALLPVFERWFGKAPSLLARAPGRVNLIGEHTDYNDGFVLPMAIDRAVWIALRPRPDRVVRVHSTSFDKMAEFSLDGLVRGGPRWAEYVKGTAWALAAAGLALRGWDGVLWGDVPIGAGLSSSAALELAASRAFAAASDLPWDPTEMARLAQRAENEWVGVRCGIMDQLASASARAGQALLIDCRTLTTEPVPLPPGASVAVLDTSTRRGLVDSAYNERRAQCEAAARGLGVPALRDARLPDLEERASSLDGLARRRARHVITENAWTLEAAAAMRRGDAAALGALMDASHASLRDDFEVVSPALDAMAECARNDPACFGARMTGAGFGGCVVALVRSEDGDAALERIGTAYRARTGLEPGLQLCRPAEGATALEIG